MMKNGGEKSVGVFVFNGIRQFGSKLKVVRLCLSSLEVVQVGYDSELFMSPPSPVVIALEYKFTERCGAARPSMVSQCGLHQLNWLLMYRILNIFCSLRVIYLLKQDM